MPGTYSKEALIWVRHFFPNCGKMVGVFFAVVVSVLFHKTVGGEGSTYSWRGAYFKLWPMGGAQCS